MSLHESLNSAAFPRKINWRVGGMTGHVDVKLFFDQFGVLLLAFVSDLRPSSVWFSVGLSRKLF